MGCTNSKPKCVICGNEAKKLLWPCGHFCLCTDCNVELSKYRQGSSELNIVIDLDESKGVQCPICRCTAIPTNVFIP